MNYRIYIQRNVSSIKSHNKTRTICFGNYYIQVHAKSHGKSIENYMYKYSTYSNVLSKLNVTHRQSQALCKLLRELFPQPLWKIYLAMKLLLKTLHWTRCYHVPRKRI